MLNANRQTKSNGVALVTGGRRSLGRAIALALASTMATMLFATRLAAESISVFEVRPGLIKTDMTREVWDKYGPRIDAGLTPSKRCGEVGRAVAALRRGNCLSVAVQSSTSMAGCRYHNCN